jgi:hypothetical protein
MDILGEVPEWPKGADCKSAGSAFGGSNPPLSTICRRRFICGARVVRLLPNTVFIFDKFS